MNFLASFVQFLVLIPAALLCYLPMKTKLRYSPARTAGLFGLVYLFFIPAAAWILTFFHIGANAVMFPVIAIFFLFYWKTLNVSLSKALAAYILNCSLLSFCYLYSIAFSAWFHPYGTYLDVFLDTVLFQLFASLFLTLILSFSFSKKLAHLIECLDIEHIWYITLPVSGFFLLFNIQCIPHSYETLHVNRVFFIFLICITLLLGLLLFLCVLFYHTVTLLIDSFRQQERTHFLEIQAEQYNILYNHMEQTRHLRHDFKHSVHALSVLANSGDVENLKKYLADYEQQVLTLDKLRPFCKNAVLNALFHHYYAMAQSAEIRTEWHISIPDPLTISTLDLSSLMGNILENAIAGCRTVPEKERYFILTIEILEQNSLYIVSSNSSDGNLKKESGIYQTTKKHGGGRSQTEHGIGLYSIRTLAEKYNGMSQFSYENGQFCVDVVLKL